MRALLSARALVRTGVTALAATALTVSLAGSASAATGTRSVTEGGTTYTMTLNSPDVLSASGQVITVTGSGYNTARGIYVALCVTPAGAVGTNKPTPCLGGQDETGTTGASHWVNNLFGGTVANSSKFTAGGSFSAQIFVKADLGGGNVCGDTVECSVVTKADHFAPNNRNSDVVVPVSFE
ncbi:hypothetical protein H9Y04_10450 [Streptomyces sp. TRM66268-LWL]|uniref:LPXTG-motif cell wall anchor domain protein n=1 Tax=Streptomyces polyasparticus TaxID=2767826 RepID=A0ABR7SBY0_9ACTN|nr:hypothetical protein [Streptomyces polyasparticus]MBC9712987.1 hypothetical protein [Streptomyces polyasparticus]